MTENPEWNFSDLSKKLNPSRKSGGRSAAEGRAWPPDAPLRFSLPIHRLPQILQIFYTVTTPEMRQSAGLTTFPSMSYQPWQTAGVNSQNRHPFLSTLHLETSTNCFFQI
jgi:hypothetical protein